jgi:putative membrane protein
MEMTIPTLIRTELARLTSTKMASIALFALMVVPLLYGGLYLWANRDPYAGLKNVPAAIVVSDTGATSDGKTVNYGKDVAKDVIKGNNFDWHEVSAKDAAAGVKNGKYDFSVTFPADFSSALESSSTDTPVRAVLSLTTDDTNSYLASTVATQAATTVRTSIVQEVNKKAADRFLLGLSDIHSSLSTAVDGAQSLADGTTTAHNGAASLATGTATLSAGAQKVAAGNAQLAAKGHQAAAQASQLAASLPAAEAQLESKLLAAGIPQATIDAALAQLAPLQSKAAAANAQLQAVTGQLDQLASGSAQVASGAASAASGASALSSGLGTLETGASSLHSGLADGLAKVPDTDAATRKAQADTISNPVNLKTDAITKATDYGAGLAPLFLSLAAWIGIYALFLIVKPLSRRAITAVNRPIRVALAGWLTPAILGALQMVTLFLIVRFALNLGISNVPGTLGIMVLSSAAFTAIILALNVLLGSVGQFLGLVLMLIQLVTAGGTFPWQTLPGPLAAVHHLLPMSYSVDALRQLMYGGSAAAAGQDAIVLGCWLVAGVAIAALGSIRMTRHRTLRDLRPSLIG